MPGSRRGLVAPQNTFLESIIRKCSGAREYSIDFLPWSFLQVPVLELVRGEERKRHKVSALDQRKHRSYSLFICFPMSILVYFSIQFDRQRDAFDLCAQPLSWSLADWPGSALVVIQFWSLQFLPTWYRVLKMNECKSSVIFPVVLSHLYK